MLRRKHLIPDRVSSHPGRARRRLAVCVEALETPVALEPGRGDSVADGAANPPDPNHGGQPDLPNTSAYVNPPNGYEAFLTHRTREASGRRRPSTGRSASPARS